MTQQLEIKKEIPGLYRIIPLVPFRRTPNVYFDIVPMQAIPGINAIDRVIHEKGAVSPGPVGDIPRPWYMHPHQDDNLMVLHGIRHVDIYTKKHGKIESFVVSANRIEKDDRILFDGPAMLVWPRGVFHRIRSAEGGSASLNFAVHYEGFDIKTNFNIYNLDTETGKFKTLREGYRDQLNYISKKSTEE
ncbi:MAG: hypothetical protein KKE17_14670 [Proteobacteria bacterium]|nr:hypothetical protein [Pseudomonadota bacterium]MBU1711242.1 hypothetical protein [Pseudomonadota bacterium]